MRSIKARFYLVDDNSDDYYKNIEVLEELGLPVEEMPKIWVDGGFNLDKYVCHWYDSDGNIVMALEGDMMLTIEATQELINTLNDPYLE